MKPRLSVRTVLKCLEGQEFRSALNALDAGASLHSFRVFSSSTLQPSGHNFKYSKKYCSSRLMTFIVPEGDGLRILTLDGGDMRCFSQLIILGELMNRLEYQLSTSIRPCDYFHSITGVGAGGVIAVLLGVLGMSVTEAMAAFASICKEVFPQDECDRTSRSKRLVCAMKRILDKVQLREDTRLEGDVDFAAGCHVSLCYSSASINGCRMFRNYKSKRQSYNPTIIEAVRATWATPGIFSSIILGPAVMKEELVSAVNGFSNPTLQGINEAHEAFGGVQMISSILSLGIGRPEASATAVERAARETEITAESLQRRFGKLGIYFRFSADQGAGLEHLPLESQFGILASHAENYFAGDIVNDSVDRYLQVSSHTSTTSLERMCRTKPLGPKAVGLPPLSAYFVRRKIPLDAIAMRLKNRVGGSPALAVLVGMSGTGKTQLSLKYAYESDDEYDHIIFLDASSTEAITKNLIARIRSIDRQFHPTTIQEALDLLVYPEGNFTQNWLIIMDNADDTKVDFRHLIPLCDHGSILITSRSASLGDLFPHSCVFLDVMSREEAVETLLLAAIDWSAPSLTEESDQGKGYPEAHMEEERRNCAGLVVDELGCLPLAVVQAACYIRRQKCLHEYPSHLKTSRDRILRWPASVGDKLPYAHSTYAAFDTNVTSLSTRTLTLLGVISFFHFSGFPRQLIELAAALKFLHQPVDLLERPPDFQESVKLLLVLFCPNGNWDALALDELLEELQNCSLVTLVPVRNVVTLRFHPLLHGWANDRLSATERTLFRAAAIRLLVCGTDEDHEYLRPHIYSHIERLPLTSDEIHVNDVAPLALTMASNGQVEVAVEACSKMYARVRRAQGDKDVKTVRASLELANAYQYQGDQGRAEQMRREAVEILTETLGENHLETAYAMACLARSCRLRSTGYQEGEILATAVLRIRRELSGPRHRHIVEALQDLAAALSSQPSKGAAEALLQEALDMVRALVSPGHVAAVRVMEQLADFYVKARQRSKSIPLQHEIKRIWAKIHGDRHATTLNATAALATSYLNQGRFDEAERMWREVVTGRREVLGPCHEDTLAALDLLATTIYYHRRYAEATSIWKEHIEGLRETVGNQHETTLDALSMLARRLHSIGQHVEAGTLWEEVVKGRRQILGATHKRSLEALHGTAEAFYLGRRYIEAEPYWKELWEGRRKELGDDHKETLTALSWLALTVQIQKRHRDAEALRKAEVEGWERLEGSTNKTTLDAFSWWARALYDQGRFKEAEILWRDVVGRWILAVGDQHESTLDAISWLALTVHAQQQYKESQKLWETILAKRRASLGDSDAATLNAKSKVAQTLHERGLFTKAEKLWKEVIKSRQELLGNEHKDTVYTLAWLERTRSAIACTKSSQPKDQKRKREQHERLEKDAAHLAPGSQPSKRPRRCTTTTRTSMIPTLPNASSVEHSEVTPQSEPTSTFDEVIQWTDERLMDVIMAIQIQKFDNVYIYANGL